MPTSHDTVALAGSRRRVVSSGQPIGGQYTLDEGMRWAATSPSQCDVQSVTSVINATIDDDTTSPRWRAGLRGWRGCSGESEHACMAPTAIQNVDFPAHRTEHHVLRGVWQGCRSRRLRRGAGSDGRHLEEFVGRAAACTNTVAKNASNSLAQSPPPHTPQPIS